MYVIFLNNSRQTGTKKCHRNRMKSKFSQIIGHNSQAPCLLKNAKRKNINAMKSQK